MNFVALKMLTGDRAKYLGLIFTIAFASFVLENEASIFAGIMKDRKPSLGIGGDPLKCVGFGSRLEFIGVKSEEPAECPRFLRDLVLEEVRS